MSNVDPMTGGQECSSGREGISGWWRRRMQRRRCRVIAGVAAVLVLAGSVLGAVTFAGGFGSAVSGRGAPVAAGVPASPTVSLDVPFTTPPVVTSAGGSTKAGLPPGLAVSMPGARMKEAGTQKLVDDTSTLMSDWIQAWATGDVSNPSYADFCIMECRFFLDETVKLWSRAQIRPAGTLRVYNVTGNTSYGGYNGAAVVCVDDSGLYAVSSSSGRAGYDPFHFGETVLYTFTGVYDTDVKHWIMTQAGVFPGDAYCGRTGTPNAPER